MLEAILADAAPPIHFTPATHERDVAADWFRRFEGAGLDGVMAKPAAGTYEPDKRVMLKVKHERDCDCVVAGFRWHKDGRERRSGRCCWGFMTMRARCSMWAYARVSQQEKRRELVEFLAPYRENALEDHPWGGVGWALRADGETDAGWAEPLEPGQGSFLGAAAPGTGGGGGVRAHAGVAFPPHGAFRRWRTDKRPQDCTYDSLRWCRRRS